MIRSGALRAFRRPSRAGRSVLQASNATATPLAAHAVPRLASRTALPITEDLHGRHGFSTSVRRYAEDSSTATVRKTVLHDYHVKNGGKMVSFGGYSMPLSYQSLSQTQSHHHTRSAASLFDVSHMVQHHFDGPGAAGFLQWLTPSSLGPSMADHQSTLSVLLNHNGGILDDLVITKINNEKFYVVTNAGRREGDLAWIAERLQEWNGKEGEGEKVQHTVLENQGLVALQGPQAAEVLAKHTDADLQKLTFGKSVYATVAEVPTCHIARGGYTGEDGFEISIAPEQTVKVTEALVGTQPTALAGLAARDSLRLEAGMCLYGHDLDESTSPSEGGLTWVVAKDRRESADFIGAERVLKDIKDGPSRRRVGLVVDGAPAREGALVFAAPAESYPEPIGVVTSGIPSPSLGQNIAMAYVANGHHKRGTELEVQVRGKRRGATVVKMPWVESKFYRG